MSTHNVLVLNFAHIRILDISGMILLFLLPLSRFVPSVWCWIVLVSRFSSLTGLMWVCIEVWLRLLTGPWLGLFVFFPSTLYLELKLIFPVYVVRCHVSGNWWFPSLRARRRTTTARFARCACMIIQKRSMEMRFLYLQYMLRVRIMVGKHTRSCMGFSLIPESGIK